MATGRDMRASLRVQFRDGAAAGLDRLLGRLNRIQAAARRISLAAGAFAALSLAGPAQAAANFDDILRQSAITAGATGAEVEAMIARNRRAFELLARATGQSSETIAKTQTDLVAAGLPTQLVDRFLPTIARAATATGASMEDMARLVRQLNEHLAITPDQMPQALAALAQAGREGNFELRDMAREMPQVLAMMRALNMQGPSAVAQIGAAFQVAMTGASSTSEAANNVLNAFQKLASPETVRNFREVGVDLEGLMRNAARQGISPFEAIVQRLRRLTGGDLFRLSELFGDRQALLGLLPILQQTARYIEIRDRAAAASPEIIDQGFADRMRGARLQLDQLGEGFTQLSRRMMDVGGEALPAVNRGMQDFLAWIDQIDARYPGLINQTTTWAVGLAGGIAALGAFGRVLGILATGLRFLLWPAVVLIGGIVGMIGTTAAIIIGIVAAIGAAAYLMWAYWDDIGPWFQWLWDTIKGYFSAFVDWLTGWASGAYEGAVALIQGAWEVLGTWFGTLWDFWVREPFERFTAWVDSWTGGAMSAVIARIQAAWSGLGSFFEGIWSGIRSGFEAIWGPIMSAIERVERFFNRSPSEGGPGYTAADQDRRRQNGRGGGAQRIEGWDAPDAPLVSRAPWAGEITIRAAPGTEVVDARTPDRNVRMSVPDRGMSYGRP